MLDKTGKFLLTYTKAWKLLGTVRKLAISWWFQSHKSSKQFGCSCAFDVITLRNTLPDDIRTLLATVVQKKAQNIPLQEGIPSIVFITILESFCCV